MNYSPKRILGSLLIRTTAVDGISTLREAISAANENTTVNKCLHDRSTGIDTRVSAIGFERTQQTACNDQGKSRVLASGGINTPVAESASAFSGSPKNSQAVILGPESGQVVRAGQRFRLRATATDPDDQPLFDASLIWTSDLDCMLGTGKFVVVEALSPDCHTITPTATDSHRGMGTDTTSIYVGYQVYLPALTQ